MAINYWEGLQRRFFQWKQIKWYFRWYRRAWLNKVLGIKKSDSFKYEIVRLKFHFNFSGNLIFKYLVQIYFSRAAKNIIWSKFSYQNISLSYWKIIFCFPSVRWPSYSHYYKNVLFELPLRRYKNEAATEVHWNMQWSYDEERFITQQQIPKLLDLHHQTFS